MKSLFGLGCARAAPAHAPAADPADEAARAAMLDNMIERLLAARGARQRDAGLTESEMKLLCAWAREVLLAQPSLLELRPPLKICGDIHGQYPDLLRLFDLGGAPGRDPDAGGARYLFLGDYVDRGHQGLECASLLLALKVRFPDRIWLLRGNHESASINRVYGFFDECKRRHSVKLWKAFTDAFNCLPPAAVVGETVFCCHGGLSPELDKGGDGAGGGGGARKRTSSFSSTMTNIVAGSGGGGGGGGGGARGAELDCIRKIRRPCEVPESGLLTDLLWSDPAAGLVGWRDNERGVSFCFGSDVIGRFLERNGLDLVCRAHQVVEDGYEFFADRRLVTLFSAPNYCGEFDNAAAIMAVDTSLMCSFQVLRAAPKHRVNPF